MSMDSSVGYGWGIYKGNSPCSYPCCFSGPMADTRVWFRLGGLRQSAFNSPPGVLFTVVLTSLRSTYIGPRRAAKALISTIPIDLGIQAQPIVSPCDRLNASGAALRLEQVMAASLRTSGNRMQERFPYRFKPVTPL